MEITSKSIRFLNPVNIDIFGKLYFPTSSDNKTSIFIVPGFTQLGTKRYTELQKYLAYRSLKSFSYDYRGVGKSGGSIGETTILDLIEDTRSAFSDFRARLPNDYFIVLGYSLGAYIVPKMLNDFANTEGIILISPSAYSSKADNLYLKSPTIDLIRSELQDIQSEVFTNLKDNNKPTLIVFGDSDNEIPLEIKTIFKSISGNHTKYISIENGVHSLLRNRSTLEKLASHELMKIINTFIQEIIK